MSFKTKWEWSHCRNGVACIRLFINGRMLKISNQMIHKSVRNNHKDYNECYNGTKIIKDRQS